MKNRTIIFILSICLGFTCRANCEECLSAADFTVLDQPAEAMMKDYLTAIVDRQFAARASLLASLKTVQDWERHAEFIRRSMVDWTGPFPHRTPLRPRITGRIDRDIYTVEKVLFESRPNFLVSANLYLPKNYPHPRPAILNVIGHSPDGKAAEIVQRRSIAQARKGFVALTIDAIGQGERQIRDYAGYRSPPGNAHQIIGTQAFLAGTHVFNFMVWDAIRAVDYLISRPEVDPARIGCTGCSGGGMMTTYVLAFEPRIAVAVPVCNPNTWSHRVHANLGTDHEQVFFGCFAAGIDPRGDPLFAHVPKPLLVNASTDDNLNPPSGVWDLSTWLYKAYAAHGLPQKFQTTMVKAPHGYNQEQRELTYAWMLKWLAGDASDYWEGDLPIEEAEDLWCTPNGNLYLQPNSTQPSELVAEYLNTHKPRWAKVRTKSALIKHRRRIRTLVIDVLRINAECPRPQAERKTPRLVAGQKLTPVILKPEEGIVLPGLWIESKADSRNQAKGPVLLYLNDKGKDALVNEEDMVRNLLKRGFRILAVDLRGIGETAPGMEEKFWDFLAGKPIFGQRVTDVRAVVQWLSQPAINAEGIYVWAEGLCALYAALAESLEDAISGMVLAEPLLAFESIVTVRVPAFRHEIIAPGVLTKFDLPQVYQALCPAKVTLLNPLAGDKSPVSQAHANKVYQGVVDTYRASGKSGNWSVHTNVSDKKRADLAFSDLVEMMESQRLKP
ncbi:MAG: alpha/beta hydrolase [Planctomycetota bacterium]